MLAKLKIAYMLSPIFLIVITGLSIYISISLYKDKMQEKSRADIATASHEQYKLHNRAIKQLEINLIKEYKNGQVEEDNYRNRVDSGFVELFVKVANTKRNSGTTNLADEQTARLADSVKQDYYRLRTEIRKNQLKLDGWKNYYCTEIAPKNKTEFMCE